MGRERMVAAHGADLMVEIVLTNRRASHWESIRGSRRERTI